MAPKNKKSEAPKRTVEDVRKEYEPKQEAMRAQIEALKQAIEVASARHHATMVDMELARDRNALTEGRLESKREVLQNAIETQRKRIEETTDKAQKAKSEAHIKNIRVQMLTEEHGAHVANRKIPEEIVRSRQLEKDLKDFFSKNPQVEALIRERDDAIEKEKSLQEAKAAYVSAFSDSTSSSLGEKNAQQNVDYDGNDRDKNELPIITAVDPFVLQALEEDIQKVSQKIAERSKAIEGVRRALALQNIIEDQQDAINLAKKQSKLERQKNRKELTMDRAPPAIESGTQVFSALFSALSSPNVAAATSSTSTTTGYEKVPSSQSSSAPLQLTFIHGGLGRGHSRGGELLPNGRSDPSTNFDDEKTHEKSRQHLFDSLAKFSSPSHISFAAVTPCVELAKTLQLHCGFVLREEVVLNCGEQQQQQLPQRNNLYGGNQEHIPATAAATANEEDGGDSLAVSRGNHLAATLLHAVRKAMTSPLSAACVPLVIIEGYVKTRAGNRAHSDDDDEGEEGEEGKEEEIVVMCDPFCDPNDPLAVVPLNTLICEVMSAAPQGWDEGTLLLELAPADEQTQGLSIMCHRGLYLSAAAPSAANSALSAHIEPSEEKEEIGNDDTEQEQQQQQLTTPTASNSKSRRNGNLLTERLSAASVVFQYYKVPPLANRIVERVLGVDPPQISSLLLSHEWSVFGGKAGRSSYAGLVASLITYLVRDSATPTAALNGPSIIKALRGALDNRSPHALFAEIGKVLRPLEQRSAAAAVRTILCVPPQLIRSIARVPHRYASANHPKGGRGGASDFFISLLPKSIYQHGNSNNSTRLFTLPLPAGGGADESVVGAGGGSASQVSSRRAWLCATRAEANKTVEERIRRKIRDAAKASEAAYFANLLLLASKKSKKSIGDNNNNKQEERQKEIKEEIPVANDNSSSSRVLLALLQSLSGGLMSSLSSTTEPFSSSFASLTIPMIIAQVVPSSSSSSSSSVTMSAAGSGGGVAELSLRNRIAAELIGREERMLYLRSHVPTYHEDDEDNTNNNEDTTGNGGDGEEDNGATVSRNTNGYSAESTQKGATAGVKWSQNNSHWSRTQLSSQSVNLMNRNSGGGGGGNNTQQLVVTWMSKRTLDDALRHHYNSESLRGGGKSGERSGEVNMALTSFTTQLSGASSPPPSSPADPSSTGTTTSSTSTSLSRAKLMAMVSAARGRGAPNVHVRGAFLTPKEEEKEEGERKQELHHYGKATMLRTNTTSIDENDHNTGNDISFANGGGRGVLQLFLTRKDVSNLPSIAGIAMFENRQSVSNVIENLWKIHVEAPLLALFDAHDAMINTENTTHSRQKHDDDDEDPKMTTLVSSFSDLLSSSIRCSFVGPEKSSLSFSNSNNNLGTNENSENDEKVGGGGEGEATEVRAERNGKSNDKKKKKNNANKNKKVLSSAFAPKTSGKSSLLSVLSNESSSGVYWVLGKIPTEREVGVAYAAAAVRSSLHHSFSSSSPPPASFSKEEKDGETATKNGAAGLNEENETEGEGVQDRKQPKDLGVENKEECKEETNEKSHAASDDKIQHVNTSTETKTIQIRNQYAATSKRALSSFLTALSAACLDPRPLTKEEREAQELEEEIRRQKEEAAAERAGLVVVDPSQRRQSHQIVVGGGSGANNMHSSAKVATSSDDRTPHVHQHLACAQPWIVLHDVTLICEDGLGASLTQQFLRETLTFGIQPSSCKKLLLSSGSLFSFSSPTTDDNFSSRGASSGTTPSTAAHVAARARNSATAQTSTANVIDEADHANNDEISGVNGETADENQTILNISRPQSAVSAAVVNKAGGALNNLHVSSSTSSAAGGPTRYAPSPRRAPVVAANNNTQSAAVVVDHDKSHGGQGGGENIVCDNATHHPQQPAAAAATVVPSCDEDVNGCAVDAEVKNILSSAPTNDKAYDENDYDDEE